MTDEERDGLVRKIIENDPPYLPDLGHFRSDSMDNPSGCCVGWTYRRLKGFLETLTDIQLDQSVQVFGPSAENHSVPVRLKPVYAAGTVEQMCHGKGGKVLQETRGPDFSHHPEQVIILIDYSQFGPEGDTAYTLLEDGKVRGNVTGKVCDFKEMRNRPRQ